MTKPNVSHSTHSTHTHPTAAAPPAPSTEPTATAPASPLAGSPPPTSPPAPSAPGAAGSSTPGTGASTPSLAPPPSGANIPQPPSSFIPDSGTTYRGVTPAKAELVALPLALDDLRKFVNFAVVLGTTVPGYAEVLQLFLVCNDWSSMRTASTAWDLYCRDQEGIGWTMLRAVMDRLRPAFTLAATTDPSLLTKYPGLATLLGMRKSFSQKAASTRRLNRKAVAEGKPPTHGKVGKARQRAAERAALAATTSSGGAGSPVATATATQGTQATAVTTPAVAVNGVNGVNGAGH
jgi:hypothetical protein